MIQSNPSLKKSTKVFFTLTQISTYFFMQVVRKNGNGLLEMQMLSVMILLILQTVTLMVVTVVDQM